MENKKGLNSKYIQFFILAAVFIGFMFFSSPDGHSTRVYDFGGRNDFATLHQGTIVTGDRFELFRGGVLIFHETVYDAYHISHSLFFYEGGVRMDISTVNIPVRDPDEGVNYLSVGGTGHSATAGRMILRVDDAMESLHLEVIITFIDGEIYESVMELDVRDALW